MRRLGIVLKLTILVAILTSSLSIGGAPAQPVAATAAPALQPPEITAYAAVLIDDQTGHVLYEKNAHEQLAPASTTKIITSILALQHANLDNLVRTDVEWSDLYDSTIMGLVRGEVLTVEDLLYGLMLPSGNDAALQLARYIGGTEERFAQMMTDQGRRLGLRNSQFKNAHGLDAEGHYSSAFDLVQFSRYAMRNPTFVEIVSAPSATRRGKQLYPLRNINRIIHIYEGANGVKTGYTDNAWQTVVASAERDGRTAYVAVMKTWNYAGDAIALLDYYFALAEAGALPTSLEGSDAGPPFPAWSTSRQPRVPQIDGFTLGD